MVMIIVATDVYLTKINEACLTSLLMQTVRQWAEVSLVRLDVLQQGAACCDL
jgi:hypothetical protein